MNFEEEVTIRGNTRIDPISAIKLIRLALLLSLVKSKKLYDTIKEKPVTYQTVVNIIANYRNGMLFFDENGSLWETHKIG